MRAIDIVAANNNGREFETLMIGVDHHFGGCFARSVGVGWGKDAGFLQLIFAVAHFAINFVCRHVDKSFNAGFLGALQKNVSAVDVGMGEAI